MYLFVSALNVHSMRFEGHKSLPVVPVGLGIRSHSFTETVCVGEIKGRDDESLQYKNQSS